MDVVTQELSLLCGYLCVCVCLYLAHTGRLSTSTSLLRHEGRCLWKGLLTKSDNQNYHVTEYVIICATSWKHGKLRYVMWLFSRPSLCAHFLCWFILILSASFVPAKPSAQPTSRVLLNSSSSWHRPVTQLLRFAAWRVRQQPAFTRCFLKTSMVWAGMSSAPSLRQRVTSPGIKIGGRGSNAFVLSLTLSAQKGKNSCVAPSCCQELMRADRWRLYMPVTTATPH